MLWQNKLSLYLANFLQLSIWKSNTVQVLNTVNIVGGLPPCVHGLLPLRTVHHIHYTYTYTTNVATHNITTGAAENKYDEKMLLPDLHDVSQNFRKDEQKRSDCLLGQGSPLKDGALGGGGGGGSETF